MQRELLSGTGSPKKEKVTAQLARVGRRRHRRGRFGAAEEAGAHAGSHIAVGVRLLLRRQR